MTSTAQKSLGAAVTAIGDDLGTITVPQAGKFLGLSRSQAYLAAQRGQIPTLRFGEKILRVPLCQFRKLLAGEGA